MKFQIVSLFPEYFKSPLSEGLLSRAIQDSLMSVDIVNPRDFAENKTGRVDDYPFGGGDSMILSYEPLKKSVQHFKDKGKVLYLTPSGKAWNAKRAKQFSKEKTLTLVCGRYGGVDQRFISDFVDEEISIGDYILNGGEAASLVLIESIFRFLPKALGNELSNKKESFEGKGLLECPQWTRPQEIKGHKLPKVLLSGNHAEIEQFQQDCSLVITALKRPDLLNSSLDEALIEAKKRLSKLDPEELQSLGLKNLL